MDVIRYLATEDEISLLGDIDEIGYGELYNVERLPQPHFKIIEITEQIKRLFEILKKVKKVNRLIIHDGEPTMIEYRGMTGGGRRCLKKMKI